MDVAEDTPPPVGAAPAAAEGMSRLQVIQRAVASGRIALTATETRIFQTLREVVAMKRPADSTVVRVAGGWVRDKLLGKQCMDVDIGLNDMMGKDFAALVNEFLEERGEHASQIGVIQSAPEQSKHLEVATFKIHGQEVDMNNLRTETYCEHSRIPRIEFGGPEEDASRRDLTVNALFYNVNDDRIEDYCGAGLRDLEDGVIRTPLPPLKTFHDDPLRVLRAARFAGRYGWTVVPELVDAASRREVREQLLAKVTRERYGIEVHKMLKSPRAAERGLRLLCAWGLFPAVFQLPNDVVQLDARLPAGTGPSPFAGTEPFVAPARKGAALPEAATTLLTAMAARLDGPEAAAGLLSGAAIRPTDREALLAAAFLAPLWGYAVPAKKWAQATAPFYVIRHSLKLPTALADAVVRLLTAAHRLVQAALDMEAAPGDRAARLLQVGHILRDVGAPWDLALTLADVLVANHALALTSPVPAAAPSETLRPFILCDSGLDGCWAWRPLCDGKFIKGLGLKGQAVGHAIRRQTDWMLTHPGAGRADCEAWVVAEFGPKPS